MRRGIRIVSVSLTVLISTLLGFTLLLGVSSRISGEPGLFGQRLYTVLSGSMAPTFRTGSVILDSADLHRVQLKAGEVITFQVPMQAQYGPLAGDVVTHRIVRIQQVNGTELIRTKGDANPSMDPWVLRRSNVLAVYDGVTVPFIGYYLNFLKTTAGVALLVLLPGGLLALGSLAALLSELRLIRREITKDDADDATSIAGGSV